MFRKVTSSVMVGVVVFASITYGLPFQFDWWPFHIEEASAAVTNNGRLFYGDQTNTAMRFQTHTTAFTFNGEQSYSHGASSSLMAHTVSKIAPTRDEVMVGTLKVDGQLSVIKGVNGYDVNTDFATAWSNSGTTGTQTCNGGSAADCTRAFDISYEQLSGKAMVVYADTTNQKLYYCYWDGSSWAPVSDCTPTNGSNDISLSSNGRPIFVTLKSKPNSNELLLGVSIEVSGPTHEVEAYRWDGDSWEDGVVATDSTNANVTTVLNAGNAMDVAWESLSGDAIVFWGDTGTASTKYKVKPSGSSWGAEQSGPSTSSGRIVNMSMDSDPISNRIIAAIATHSSQGNVFVWKPNGSTAAWTAGNSDTTIEGQASGSKTVDAVWSRSGSTALWVAQDASGTPVLEYQTVTCTGSGCTFGSITNTIPKAGTDDGVFIALTASPNSADIMMLFADIDRNLYAQHWNGSAWQGAASAALEADVAPGTSDSANNYGFLASFSYIPYSAWQRNWRFFDDETSNDPSTGLNGAAENTAPTGVDLDEFIRLRVNVAELSGQGQTDARKKLQYTSGCSPNNDGGEAGCTWTDVGDTSETSAVWRYATSGETCASCSDGTTSTTSRLTGTNQGSPSVFYVSDKDAAADTDFDHTAFLIREIDYPLKAEAVTSNTTYYFRIYDVDQGKPVYREQDNDGNNDCASSTCTYPSLTTTPPTFEQAAYGWFANADSTNVGAALAAQDTAATAPAQGTAFRLRQLLHIGTAELASSGESFKLQFAQKSGTCDTGFSGETYADITGATAIAYYNNTTPTDASNLTNNGSDPTHSGHTIVNQTYEESNNFTNAAAAIPAGQDGKWDFSLVDLSATSTTSYCFRVVKSSGSTLDTYTTIPEILTSVGGPTNDQLLRGGRWFNNGVLQPFTF